MASELVIHGFETSNNLKVRVALGYKGLPYQFRSIDPADRDEVLRLSGQSLTPVMVHGDVVLFDSAAIMRYLDANFPDTPKLYGADRNVTWSIESWEGFARGELAAGMMAIVHMRLSGGDDATVVERGAAAVGAATRKLEARLRDHDWLVGDAMTAADIAPACVIARVQRGQLFALPDDIPHTLAWTERVMAYDRGPEA
jgi:glutathione S-transferase